MRPAHAPTSHEPDAMTANPPHFDADTQQLVTRLLDLSDAGDFGSGELQALDAAVYTRMAEHYGLENAPLPRTFG